MTRQKILFSVLVTLFLCFLYVIFGYLEHRNNDQSTYVHGTRG